MESVVEPVETTKAYCYCAGFDGLVSTRSTNGARHLSALSTMPCMKKR